MKIKPNEITNITAKIYNSNSVGIQGIYGKLDMHDISLKHDIKNKILIQQYKKCNFAQIRFNLTNIGRNTVSLKKNAIIGSVTENVTSDSVTKSNHIQLNHLSTGRQSKKVRFRIDEDISEAEEEISDNFGPELKNIIKEHPQLVSEDMEHAVDRMFEPCYLEPFNPDVKLSFKDGNFDSLTKNERDEIYNLCSEY